jgi:hypothetical protein
METVRLGGSLAADLAVTSLAVSELWAHYIALGGNHNIQAVEAYLYREAAWSPQEHDVLAQAVHEHLIDLGLAHPSIDTEDL